MVYNWASEFKRENNPLAGRIKSTSNSENTNIGYDFGKSSSDLGRIRESRRHLSGLCKP